MSAEGRQLDPEIAALLREVPRYQGLKLLGGPLEFVRGLSEKHRAVPAFRATSVERHLLETYREEVAWLLRQASVSALRSDPASFLVSHVGVNERIRVLSENELESEVEHHRRYIDGGRLAREGSALEELSALLPVRSGNATRLAAASLSIAPRTDTRICLALSMMHEKRMKEAKGILLEIISSRPIALDTSIAWTNLGTVYVAQGCIPQARYAYKMGADAADNPAPTISWFLNACQLGDAADALVAAGRVDSLLPEDHPAVDELLEPSARPNELTAEFKLTANLLRDRVGPTAKRILDV